MVEMKCCTSCKVEKPLGDFYLYRDGSVRPACKKCANAQCRRYREKNLDAVREMDLRWREQNRDRQRVKAKERYRANKPRHKANAAEWASRNPEKVRETKLRYYHRNREKARESARVRRLLYPESKRGNIARYRAQKANATPQCLSVEDKAALAECYKTASELAFLFDENLHVDHILPIRSETVCGMHVPWNLRIVPALANWSKNNRWSQVDALSTTGTFEIRIS